MPCHRVVVMSPELPEMTDACHHILSAAPSSIPGCTSGMPLSAAWNDLLQRAVMPAWYILCRAACQSSTVMSRSQHQEAGFFGLDFDVHQLGPTVLKASTFKDGFNLPHETFHPID